MLEKAVSGALVIISIAYLYMAKGLSFGSASQPGVGFMPTIVGAMAVVLSIINFISVMLKKDNKKANKKDDDTAPKMDIIKLVKFVAGCIVYVFMLDYTGFLIATFVVMVYLLKVTEVQGWVLPVIVSAGTSLGFYIVFEKMLGVLLP
ncbi:MAG TPA: tripartite tricarboxylate transporter TctB family protein [Thermoanaerobacterales bacterium]|nr:tripartite tricarboxylate transporter TctB family protein [Thermoanaerobacterales bacterium]